MALDYYIVKSTDKEAVVSVTGTNDAVTLSLSSLLTSNQRLGATGAVGATGPVVNISAITSSGLLGSAVSVRRGATGASGSLVFTGAPENCPTVQFNQFGYSLNNQNNKDLLVTHGGTTAATTILVLHKQDGYYSTIETAQFSIYDDTTKVGE